MVKFIAVIVGLFIVVTPFFFDAHSISALEIRYYVVLALLTLIAACFGVLRIYNAMVANTRFIIKLQKELISFYTHIKRLDNTIVKSLTPTIRSLIDRIKKDGEASKKS